MLQPASRNRRCASATPAGSHEPASADTTLLVGVERGLEDVVARIPGVEANLAGHAQAQEHGTSDGDAGIDDGADLLRASAHRATRKRSRARRRRGRRDRGARALRCACGPRPVARRDRAGRRSSRVRRGPRSSRAGPRSAGRAAAAPAIASSSPSRSPGRGSRSDPVRAARLLRGRVRGTGRAHPPVREARANRC